MPKKTEPPLPRRCTCWQRCLCYRCHSSPPPRLSTTSSSSPCPTFYLLRTSAWWESHTILLIIILNHLVVLPLSIFAHINMVIPTPSPSSTTLLSSSFILIISFIHILAWWLVTSEFERTVNFCKIKSLTSPPHLQCQFNLHARRTNENTFEI